MRLWCEAVWLGDRIATDVEVTIADGRFIAVQAGVPPALDAQRRTGLTMAGLANGHSHAFHRALRGRTQRGPGTFWTWREVMYRVARRLDPDSYHRLARAVFAEMVTAGVTTVGEFHYLHHSPTGAPYDDPNAMAESLMAAAAEAGLRLTLLDTLYQHGGLTVDGHQPVEGAQHRYRDPSPDAWVERVEDLVGRLEGASRLADRVRIGAAMHSVRAVDPEGVRTAVAWAAGRNAVLHAHVSEQPAENEACLGHHGLTPTTLLDHLGALGPRFTAVHATHLSGDDIDRLGAHGCSVCLCPTTERDLGDGIGPSSELAVAGVRLSVGSDSHAVIDLLEEARLIELHERLRILERGRHGAERLLAAATVDGHRSLGWDDVGTIEPGARADLVTLDAGTTRTAGVVDPDDSESWAALLFVAGASDVTHVMVDGTPVVTDGRHHSIDVAAELETTIRELLHDA